MNIVLVGAWDESNLRIAQALKEAGHSVTPKASLPGAGVLKFRDFFARVSPLYAGQLDTALAMELEKALLPYDAVIVNDEQADPGLVARAAVAAPVVVWDRKMPLNAETLTRNDIIHLADSQRSMRDEQRRELNGGGKSGGGDLEGDVVPDASKAHETG